MIFQLRNITYWLVLAAGLACMSVSAQSQDSITVVAYGGTTQRVLEQKLFAPYTQASGTPVISAEYNGEMARIQVMVDSQNVVWNVVMTEGPELMRYCEAGLFEPLPWETLGDTTQLLDGAVQTCGSASYVWGVTLSWSAERLKTAPTGWRDFWDVQKIPGKRGMRKRAVYNLEFALIADGVAPDQVYQVLATRTGQDRAFAKLDELKPHIQWWEAGAQPPQWLVAGDVVMSTAYHGRILLNREAGHNLDLTWVEGLYTMDYWAIPKGAPNQKAAHDFIAFALRPEVQKNLTESLPYGPSSVQAGAQLAPEITRRLPTAPENLAVAFALNDAFWADWGEDLEERFAVWAAR